LESINNVNEAFENPSELLMHPHASGTSTQDFCGHMPQSTEHVFLMASWAHGIKKMVESACLAFLVGIL
jgi:hypothetical protein